MAIMAWLVAAFLAGWIVYDGGWHLYEKRKPFEYRRVSLATVEEDIREFYRRAVRGAELVITSEGSGHELRVRKWYTWHPMDCWTFNVTATDVGSLSTGASPLADTIREAVQAAKADPKSIQSKVNRYMRKAGRVPEEERRVMHGLEWTVGSPTRRGEFALATTHHVGPASVAEDDAFTELQALVRFFALHIYGLDSSSRFRVRVEGKILSRDELFGSHVSSGRSVLARWLRGKSPRGKPYRHWHWVYLGRKNRWRHLEHT